MAPPEATAATTTRTACVRVPAWPLVAAIEARERADETVPEEFAVIENHRIIAVSAAAAAAGVEVGMKKRSAEALCPGLMRAERDRDTEWVIFEAVAAAVDTVASGVEALAPGMLLMHARGPARHAGGEELLAQALVDAVADLTGWECTVGIADGPLAAILASLTGRRIHEGASARFLAPHPIAALAHAPVGQSARLTPSRRGAHAPVDRAEVIDLLGRLGIATLGDFAALPAASVQERFGAEVALLHLLSRGEEPAEPPRIRPPQPILVERALDPPLERMDQAAFVARPMAEELDRVLRERGAACTRLRIVARTEHGDEVERTWRHDGALSTSDIVDRVRWQCDGWISAMQVAARGTREGGGAGTANAAATAARTARGREAGAITHLQLIPLQLASASLHAPALWGQAGSMAVRAARALTRIQSLAGENAVLVPTTGGGRLLAEAAGTVPFRSGTEPHEPAGPWPGRLPRPLPTTVFARRPAARLLDSDGAPVHVEARGLMNAAPATLVLVRESEHPLPAALAHLPRERPLEIALHSAPVILDQQWWAPTQPSAHRGARLQIALDSGDGLVLLSDAGQWSVEGCYD
ncbi:MAG: DNA polymerase Y family protein [Dermabacter sp.]|nr:DNA polymerase Y family protein [Dermabacter sp.]